MDKKELIFLATCIFIAQTRGHYDLFDERGIETFKDHFAAYQRVIGEIYDSPSK